MRSKKMLSVIFTSVLVLSACGGEPSKTTTANETDIAEENRVDIKSEFTIDTDVSDGYELAGNTYTFTKGGEYLLSGKLDGNIIINIPDDEKLELMLAGVSISNSSACPIYVQNGKSVTITAKGTTFNEIIDKRITATDDDEGEEITVETAKAAIYSCADLNFKGQGTLIVEGNYNNGIHTKKDLEIKNLTLKCTGANHSLKGNKSITIESGNINLISISGHGLKTSDDSVADNGNQKGNVIISGGSINIESGADGINSVLNVNISDEANLTIAAADDGIHADEALTIDGGYVNIVESYEGLEGHYITVNGGNTYVYASDDGLNASNPKTSTETDDGFGFGRRGGFGGGGMEATDACITINGGYLDVTTPSGDTDAIDSNGNYIQTGGFVIVKGGASSGMVAGSIDVNGSIEIAGGTCVALGGICETPVNSCNAYVLNGIVFSEGEYNLSDSNGNEILKFVLSNSYSNGWICSELLGQDESYTLKKGTDEIASWTQELGTMGSGNAGGYGPGGNEPGGFRPGGFEHGDFGHGGGPGHNINNH